MSDEHEETDRPSNLVVLPVAEGMQRERVSEERLHEQPDSLQSWFEASGQDAAADERLRGFVDGLLGQTPRAAPSPVADDPITLDDEEPSTLEIRLARQQRRLAAQPLVLVHWFEAAAEGGAADRRLRAFAAQQLPTPPLRTPPLRTPTLRTSPLRPWMGLAVAACALLAVGLAGWMGPSPLDPSGLQSSPVVGGLATVVEREVPVESPPAQPETLEPSAPLAAAPALVDPPELAPTAPHPAPAQLRPDEAPQVAIVETLPPNLDLAELLPAPVAPRSPALSTAGEIDATTVAWRGTVVPGLNLRVDQGFGFLAGTEAEPTLNLASDSAVRVDLDREAVEQGFNTFTIQTPSGTVRVLGTRYTIRTPSGRTEVATRRGLVQLECQDGRRKLVAAGQSESCEARADTGLLAHMQALDRPALPDQVRLSEQEQYNHLKHKLSLSSPEAFVATADLMLSRALSDAGLRRVIEAVRIEALCSLGWNGPARKAAALWLESEGTVGREPLSQIASGGCPAG